MRPGCIADEKKSRGAGRAALLAIYIRAARRRKHGSDYSTCLALYIHGTTTGESLKTRWIISALRSGIIMRMPFFTLQLPRSVGVWVKLKLTPRQRRAWCIDEMYLRVIVDCRSAWISSFCGTYYCCISLCIKFKTRDCLTHFSFRWTVIKTQLWIYKDVF